MFGYFRFILAFFVLISHVGVKISGLNPGVVAVVIFYMLAGHVVSRLWTDIIPDGRGKLLRFYLDRVLRIFPLYIYIALLTLVFLLATDYADPQFSPFRLAGNFLIVPLNYYMAMDTTILTSPNWCLIPPAWSLGAELQAYLLMPFVLRVKCLKIILVILSTGVYSLANASIIHPDYFGYRLIFGVFFMFVIGNSLQVAQAQGRNGAPFDRLYPLAIWVSVAVLAIKSGVYDSFGPAYTRETFAGLLIGIPLIHAVAKSGIRLPFNALLGSLSYGVFLSHFLVMWWLDHTGYVDRQSIAYIPSIVLGSIIIAYAGVALVERNVDSLRKKSESLKCLFAAGKSGNNALTDETLNLQGRS